MTSNQRDPLMPWATLMLQWPVQWAAKAEAGIASNRGSARRGEYVLESCTQN